MSKQARVENTFQYHNTFYILIRVSYQPKLPFCTKQPSWTYSMQNSNFYYHFHTLNSFLHINLQNRLLDTSNVMLLNKTLFLLAWLLSLVHSFLRFSLSYKIIQISNSLKSVHFNFKINFSSQVTIILVIKSNSIQNITFAYDNA